MLFIVNPAAGGGRARQRWARFQRNFFQGAAVPEVVFTSAPGDAARVAAKAVGDYEVLVAAGGDGTAREVAEGLISAGSNSALGILPLGTGNDVARIAGIGDWQDAGWALANGQAKPIDLIRMECQVQGRPRTQHALVVCGLGIIGPLLRAATPRAKRFLGQKLAYWFALFRALWSYQSPPLRVCCDGNPFEGPLLFLGASNSEEAGGGMRLAPGARSDDGLLNINLVYALGRWEALLQLRRLFQGRHPGHPKVRYFTARTVTVEADRPLEVAADGELIGYTPARFEVSPGALKLVSR